MLCPKVVYEDECQEGFSHLSVTVAHGTYNSIKYHGSKQILVFSHSQFIQALCETLPLWLKAELPGAYKSIREIVAQITITEKGERPSQDKLKTEILLNDDCLIIMGYNRVVVKIPIDWFVEKSIAVLAENAVNNIDIGGFSKELRDEFKMYWEVIKRDDALPQSVVVSAFKE